MTFSKRITYFIFGLMLLLNIILHYPLTPHEQGWDSFVVHSTANSLSELGFAKWWLHAMSIPGYYPYSFESAVSFLISGISQLTGLNIDKSILLYSSILGLLSIFTIYLMASSIYGNENIFFNLLVSYGFSTAPAILDYTSWTAPNRSLFIVILLPLIIYLLLKTNHSYKFHILLFLMLAMGFVTHHYIYFASIIIASEIILKVGYKYNHLFKQHILIKPTYKNVCYLFFITMLFMIPLFTGIFMENERGYSGSKLDFILMLIKSYSRYSGILILFALSGFMYLALKNKKNNVEWFFLINFALLSPFFFIETYMKWFLPTYLIIFSCIGLVNIFKNSRLMLVVLILLSILVSGYFQFLHFNTDDDYRYLDEKTYTCGLWISDKINGSMAGSSIFTNYRLCAISQVPILTLSDMLNYINGFINYDETMITQKYSMLSLDYYFQQKNYEINNTNGEWYATHLSEWGIDDRHTKDLIHIFNISHFITENTTSQNTNSKDEFSSSFDNNDVNKIFCNGRISIWTV